MSEKLSFRFRHAKSALPQIIMLLLVVLSVSLPAAPAKATSLTGHIFLVHQTLNLTFLFTLTPHEEALVIRASYRDYLLQQKTKGVGKVGQVSINDSYPTDFVLTGDEGVATFHFVDTTTELPSVGPDVDEVIYEWDTDPTDAISWVTLGSSTNASDEFAIAFTMPDPYPYEPMFRGTPYFQGEPVVIPGVDDENVAVGIAAALVPEPTSILLLCPGILTLWMMAQSAKRKRKRVT